MKAQNKNMRLPNNHLLGCIVLFFFSFASVTSQNIQQLEYYFDADPGIGNGTLVTANMNTGELSQALNVPTTGLDVGFHKLYVRSQDNLGTWGLYENVIFYVSDVSGATTVVSNIAGAEYWFDQDPGLGNGTSLNISGSPSDTLENFVIPLGVLDVGFHTIGIRTQNLDGTWSLFDTNIFYVSEDVSGSDPISNISGAEYWFDIDPGFGNGNALTISGSPNETMENFIIPLGTLTAGFHEIGLRTQNLDGTWSLFDKKTIYVFETDESLPPSSLTEVEFLFDEELGFGTGTSVPITPTGNPDEYLVVIPTTMLSCGFHDISLSIKNATGDYSLYQIGKDLDLFDTGPPTIVSQDITIQLDATGNASITASDVDNGTFDDCELVSIGIDITDFTCDNLGPNTVTLTATDASDNVSMGTAIVTVEGVLTTYAGGVWDMGVPNLGSRAVIDAPLVTGGTNIEACACEVNASLTVQAGDYLLVNRDITVNGTLTVEHQGSIVQLDDNANVTNSGAITVEKITPTMAAKSFMISGSPMTNETREGVFGSSYIVRNHVTSNFVPNPDVEAVSPGVNNWADDNGNNWRTHTGGLNVGEGYMVFPQPDGTTSGSFTQNHTSGTLNNGDVNFNLGYNGTQNASPNLVANPYASAIDVELFFDHPANSNIDVVYFWEHITPLSVSYPGYNEANFNMGDISVYSESLGSVGATNGGDAPTQFISSGQGFGVKPLAGGIATFNNAMRVTGSNDTYRSNTLNRDRLWMRVYNDTYGLGSTALIGFTENASDEFINSEDIYRLPTPVSLYSEIDTGEELVINALGSFEVNDSFYLSFSTQVKEPQEYRISISDMDGINFENVSVYLIDSFTGSVTNLTEEDYSFLSGETVDHKRFKIVFENTALGSNQINLRSISLYPNPTENIVTIVSPQTVLTSATVYDIRGRKVHQVDFRNQTVYQIDFSSMETAVYFIDIATENGIVMKRIMKN